ncbi:MAG TPA: ATP-binding protein [Gemmatimonadales bacterium]|nr:ATP-binding protein [Gemmatimonadales bacterium]
MANAALVERLAALPTLADIPRSQLEWLVAHGTFLRFETGDIMFQRGTVVPGPYVVLCGRFAVHVERDGVVQRVREWKTGDISGRLPFSRMTEVPGNAIADEPVECVVIPWEDVKEMTRECYEFTALCVHEMLDRARQFRAFDLQDEKLKSLGRLSGSLAHELNNPSSAVIRSAKGFASCRKRLASASLLLGTAGLSTEQLAVVHALESSAMEGITEARSPMVRADREDVIAEWLEEHGIDVELSEALADSALELSQLRDAARIVTEPHLLQVAIEYVTASVTANRLTSEISVAAERIQALVAAIKDYTHRDRAQVPEPVNLAKHLTDTLTLLGSKARAKGVTMELDIEPNLPDALGLPGELNQVWLNILDNAIDAVPEAGRVVLTAGRDRESIAVSIVDNGKGIPEKDLGHIFEPFFTTKPVGQGSGMGLDIVQAILVRNNGSIEVSSRPGRTEFRVRLPIAEAPQQVKA